MFLGTSRNLEGLASRPTPIRRRQILLGQSGESTLQNSRYFSREGPNTRLPGQWERSLAPVSR